MDRTEHSPTSDNVDAKSAFRKPSNDVANRKYRRRSPVNASSSSDGSPEHNHRSSPMHSREDSGKVSEHLRGRKENKKELDRDSDRNQHGRSGDSYKHDRYSSRSTHHHSKREEYSTHERDADEDCRKYRVSPSRPGRDSKVGHHFDRRRQEGEHSRPRDHMDRYSRDKHGVSGYRSKDKEKDVDPLSDRAGSGRRRAGSRSEETEKDRYALDRDRLDEKRDLRRSSGDRRSDRTHSRDDRRKFEDSETKKEKEVFFKAPKDRYEGKSVLGNEDQEIPAKRLKQLSSENFTDGKNDVEEKLLSSSKPTPEAADKVFIDQSHSRELGISGDVDAAKVAAMKAAELVNKNLVGTGYLTTDQKKKLLWGNKKSTATEEPAHRWDNVLVGDRERQEKFNKLMGVKGNAKTEQKLNNDQDIQTEKQKELQLDLEKQYTAGLRRRDGRTVGLGL